MPLSPLQRRVMGAIATQRDPESYVHLDGSLACPDPDRPETLEGLVAHHGSRKGSWPSSPEIGSVMLRERPLPR